MRTIMLALTLATKLPAQDTAQLKAPAAICFRSFDASRCRTYLILELGVDRPIVTTHTVRSSSSYNAADFETRAMLALGVARNLPNHRSVGVAALIDLGDGFAGIEGRYRKWFVGLPSGYELSAGLARREIPRPECTYICYGNSPAVGARAGAGLAFNPYITVFTRAELLHSNQGWHAASTAGISANSTASLVAAAAAVAYFFIGMVTLGSDY